MHVEYLGILVWLAVMQSAICDVQSPYRYPTKCEVCKILVLELKDRLEESGRKLEVLRLGHGLDESKLKAVDYRKSELRLIEALHEPHICNEVKKYNVHAERVGSLRYAKGQTETMETLHGLKNKGVKVDLGIPYEMWDAPNAEVGQMNRECYAIIEDYEEDIEQWYQAGQTEDLVGYLCRNLVLKGEDTECLDETWTGVERVDSSNDKAKNSAKGDSGKASNKSKKKKKKDEL